MATRVQLYAVKQSGVNMVHKTALIGSANNQ